MLTERNKPQPTVRGAAHATLESTLHTSDSGLGYSSLGQLPAISVLAAIGFAVVAVADYASRTQLGWAEPTFWIGMVVLTIPPVVALLRADASRVERIGLVMVLAIGLYLVKIAYSPAAFNFPDELAHDYNLLRVLQVGHLFQPNPVLAITARYPGLVGVTAALASTTGLTDFQSGLVVVGAARLLLVLTLFLLVERLTHSARVGGLAAALYMANPNYLFFSAEFAYESLALPLSGLVLLAALRRDEVATPGLRTGWTTIAVLAALAVVITHHLSSYALAVALWGIVIMSRLSRVRARPAPWDLAVFVSLCVAVWLGLVASDTWIYLTNVLRGALLSLIGLLTLQQAPRQVVDLTTTPLWQELLAFGSIVLITIGSPFGLVRLWRGSRRQSIALLLGLAGVVYLPIQLLRLTPASWETGNRSSEYLFAGVAFLLALALIAAQSHDPRRATGWLPGVGLAAYVGVIFLGGVVVSWRPDLRLPRAYVTLATGHVIQPEGVRLAEWADQFLGANNSLAIDESNALLMATYGQQSPWSGSANGIRSMLAAPTVDSGSLAVLTGVRAHYVVLDRRVQSADHLLGVYPLTGPGPAQPSQLVESAAFTKFDLQPDVSRIADTGHIVIYDVSKLSSGSATPQGH